MSIHDDASEIVTLLSVHVLDDVADVFRTYMAMNEEEVTACVLFCASTHRIEDFDTAPYLRIGSLTEESGKTRCRDIVEMFSANPVSADFGTRSAIVRLAKRLGERGKIPTIIIDETDKSLHQDDLIGILNGGFNRGHTVPLVVPKDDTWETVQIDPFGPKVLAGIGDLPDKALASRTIPVNLRRHVGKRLPKLREKQKREVRDLATRLSTWAKQIVFPDFDSLPADFMPEALGDRQADMWEPLLLMADAAGGEWPLNAREAATALHRRKSKLSTLEALLHDIKSVFDEQEVDSISSDGLMSALSTEPYEWAIYRTPTGVPWTWSPIYGDCRAAIIVAQLLKPLEIMAVRMQFWDVGAEGARQARGYKRGQFEDAWLRYGIA